MGEGKRKGKESKPKPERWTTNVTCSVSSSRSESEHDVFFLYIYSSYVTESGCVWYLFDISLLEARLTIFLFILLHEKFLQSDWLRAVVFQLNLKYLDVKITNLCA